MTATERDRLIVVEQKLDAILDKIGSFVKCVDDHEKRIRELEAKPAKKWNGAITALVGAVIGGAVTAAIAALSKVL